MAKKPATKIEEEENEIDPISFELPHNLPFYILEFPDDDKYHVFNALEGAVESLDEEDELDTKDTKLLSFTLVDEQFSVSQISWAEIYKISRALRKKGG